MAEDNYYKFIYVILDELYDSKKSGVYPKLVNFGHERFGISESYWKEIMMDLKDEGVHWWLYHLPYKNRVTF
ncbi:MAG: YjcQ family protein [Ruminococcus sp.]|nr:YjcQ family protein [Ruminococcus sp.]